MKILIAIESSNQELYVKLTQILKNIYKQMKKVFDLQYDVDVISYTAGEKTEFVGDVLYFDCNDNDGLEKTRELYNFVLCDSKYDLIIKTNATTLVNLNYIDEFIKYVDTDCLYTGCVLIYTKLFKNFYFPGGNFIMFTKNFIKKNYDIINLDNAYNELLSYNYKKSNDFNEWHGIGDDIVFGKMLQNKNFTYYILPGIHLLKEWNNEDNINDCVEHYYNIENINEFLAFVTVRTNLKYEDRLIVEPIFLKMIGEIFMSNIRKNVYTFNYTYIKNE